MYIVSDYYYSLTAVYEFTYYLITVIILVRLILEMERKTTICHVCGIRIKRFAEHLATAHRITDHKKEKVSSVNFIYDSVFYFHTI